MRKQILFIIVLVCCGLTANAQRQWTLQQCIETAVENSLEVDKARLGVGFSDINLQQARHNRYPSVSASSNVGLNLGRSINPVTNLFETRSQLTNSLSLNSNVVLFNGFRITNSLRQARLDLEASSHDADQVARDVALATANNYLGVLFADENLAIARAQVNLSREQLTRTNQLIKAGSRPVNESLDIEAQIATDEQAVIIAENSRIIALLNLKNQLRLGPDAEIEVVKPKDIAVYSDPDVLTFEEVYTQAYMNQPSMKAALLRQQSAELAVKIAKAGLIPTLGAGGSMGTNYVRLPAPIPNDSYSKQLDNNLSYGVGMSLSVPIYQNYSNRLNVQRAKLAALDQKNTNAQTENALIVTVQQAITDARAAKRKLEAA